MHNSKAKLKTLYVIRILQDEIDAKHGLLLREFIERRGDYGIKAERKGLNNDIQVILEFGVGIQTFQMSPMEYAIVRRDSDLSELILFVYAVKPYKLFTKRQSRALTTNPKFLASDHERGLLDHRIYMSERITSKSDNVFGCINTIQEALRKRLKVEFMYYKYCVDGTRCATHESRPHLATLMGITFDDDYYYLTAWNSGRDAITKFRIGRMEKIKVPYEKAPRNEQIAHHDYESDKHESFGVFIGELTTTTLLAEASMTEIIMDRFGGSSEIYTNEKRVGKAVVKIHKIQRFFGCVTRMDETITINEPKSLKEEYNEYLLRLIEVDGG